ncbi:Protein kinase domain-containing protein [Mycena venus]|uniref:Protein kinase domain-containing protein n=1 Tax=Mycena venus TaxID=2733690 RepID=A0A8H6XGQ8_9AGAR|nr:Protein kinase domain-containing protein [Mycena venus]
MHPPSASHFLPDLTGEFIDDGSLELLCLLGSGAYGKVYKALDITSPPHDLAYYAVKQMRRYEPHTREAQIQENELLVHRMVSDHPRVVTFHHHFFTEEFVFVVLELCTGGDFFNAMVDRKVYRGNPALIKRAFGELLDAVEFIHRNSVYHRDIKPENILCNSAGTDIRLADFGLSTQVAVSTQFGCGSRFYMSPESFDREHNACYSARHSDLWALSVIFTNMISCRHPWYSADLSDPGFAAFRADSDYLLKALNITRPANALLKQCFHMNPLRRPTLAQFRQAVDAMESFSLEDKPLPVPLPRLPTPRFPVVASMSLEWAVAPPSGTGECEKTPKPSFPIHMPQPLKFTPFVLGSSSALALPSVAGPPASPPPSPLLLAPVRLVVRPERHVRVSMCSIPSLALDAAGGAVRLPALPKRAYLRHVRPSCAVPVTSANVNTKPTTEYRTVASNARPTLPTRRQFLTARRILQVKE